MKIQGKKGATEGSLWKVITLALIVLVIVIAIFGIMRFGLIDYIKNIPGFGNKSEDKVGRIAPTDSISLSSKEVLNTKSTVDDDGKQRSHLRIVAGNIKINRLLWLTSIFATLDEDTQTYTINPDIFEESYVE